MSAILSPPLEITSLNKIHIPHVIRLKQCTTASVVSRMLGTDQKLLLPVNRKSQAQNIGRIPKLTLPRRCEVSLESASRRSRVIEMNHSGAEKLLEPQRIRESTSQSPKIKIDGSLTHDNAHSSAKKHFRIDADEPRSQHLKMNHANQNLALFQSSIDVVKSAVDESLITDIHAATKNAGNWL